MNNEKKVIKISDVVRNQLPEFISEENPNFSEFLNQYYVSQEYTGGPVDLSENLTDYKNVESFDKVNLIKSTTLTSGASFIDSEIYVESTNGWPDSYGLFKINNEIITYTGITTNSFLGCIRGFSGVESLSSEDNPEVLVFSKTEADFHSEGDSVINLSNLFLVEFFNKIKYQFTPGFEEVELNSKINPQNFISKAKSFYQSKGTDEAFKILFKVLYDQDVKIIKPREFCFTPSDDKWVVTETFVCDLISGDPLKIKGQTLYQDSDPYNSNVLEATGSIYEVESFKLDDKVLYKIKIFAGYSNNISPKGSITGVFVSTPKTYAVENVNVESTTIFVDSTVGFPQSGILNINGEEYTYSDKTNNQFIGVTGITSTTVIGRRTEIYGSNFVYSYEDGDISAQVRLKVNNVLSGIKSSETLYALDNDPIRIENIGNTVSTTFTKSLYYNHPLTIPSGISTTQITNTTRNYFKEGFSIVNGLALSKYDHNLKLGDTVNLFAKSTEGYELIAPGLSVNTSLSKEFSVQQISNTSILGKKVLFRRNLKKTKATPFSKLYNNIQDKFTSNIQDCYVDDNYYYVTSNGLPDYEINPYIREFSFTVNTSTLVGAHNFYDGEAVKVVSYTTSTNYNNKVGIDTGLTYYVTRLSPNTLGLTENRDNVGKTSVNFFEYDNEGNLFGTVDEIVLISSPLYGNNFTSSKLFKKIPKNLEFSRTKVETAAGPIGIFVNGVEIQNYKSYDKIYYGQIETVDVLNGGTNYSLINPPSFEIFNGSEKDETTFLIPQMKGVLKDLVVVNAGYDYEDVPIVTITGGNNDELSAQVKMKSIDKLIEFNATTRDTVVNTVNNELRFGTNHGFITGEPIVYETFNTIPIGIGSIVSDGTLLNNSVYYAVNIGAGTSIKLALNQEDAIAEKNLINIRTTGGGIQRFKSLNKIQVIDKVNVLGQNINFEYKKLSFGPEDINVYDNIFTCIDHQFNTRDKVVITAEGTYLDGATPNQIYYILKLDNDRFQLTTDPEGKNILNIISTDFATTYFVQYPPITANVFGKIKKTASAVIGYGATIIPVVEGSVISVRVQRGLAKPAKQLLGSSNVLNYHKRPTITVLEGKDASFAPVIEDGKIIDVIVKNAGENYFNNFELKVVGNGYGAVLQPVISNGEIYNAQVSYGQIIDVIVANPGVGYASTNTTIQVVSKGENLKVSANLTSWTINEATKLGISNLNNGTIFGKKYSLFGNIFGTFFLDQNLRSTFNIPNTPVKHSPIVGWAYDGCPIYGPYAFANTDGTGSVIRMKSGYSRSKISPPANLDCIEDYIFTNSGTLDRNNGRFCITPEYPDGIYAYFCTLDDSNVPAFPYIIGNNYEYTPQQENFDLKFNQNLDFNKLNIVKYTKPYRIEDKNNYYEYFKFESNSLGSDAVITSSSSGKVDSIEIIDSGLNYEIGDKILFDIDNLGGVGAYGEVVEVEGVGITTIQYSTNTFPNVKLLSINTGILGITTIPHNFSDQSFITITGISTTDYSEIEGTRKIRINVEYPITSIASTLSDSTTTGIITGLSVKEPLFSYNIDDQFKIQSETFKVVGLDFTNNLLNVLREPASPGYGIGATVVPLQNRFTFEYKGLDKPLTQLDETYYFNPVQSVSLGLGTSVGFGNTLAIYPLGVGSSITKYVQYGGLYLPNNKFKTGDRVVYESNASSIVTNLGNLDSISDLFIIKLSSDVVGLVNEKNKINDASSIIQYTSVGTGILHKLKTVRNVTTCTTIQNKVKVATAETHGLSVNDNVKVSVISGIVTNYTVGYSTVTKRVLINSQGSVPVNVYANDTVVFDLSSLSLSGKEFGIYTNDSFNNEYFGNEENGLEVIKTASELRLNISEFTPKTLYYNLKNITSEDEIYPDISLKDYNKIIVNNSLFNTDSFISTTTDYTFEFDVAIKPERPKYTNTLSTLKYNVKSPNVKGPIGKTKVLFNGSNYKKLPLIKQIVTKEGTGANLFAFSNTIGKLKNAKVTNTQSIFPTDTTLRPVSNVFSTIKLTNNFEVVQCVVNSPGSKYLTAPTLKLYNRTEDLIKEEFTAIPVLKNTSINEVKILNPGSNLKSTDDEILVLDNSNGIRVLSASVAGIDPYQVTLTLETPLVGFTTEAPLPIQVGDEILVENIVSTSGVGFNSKDFKYVPFKVTFVDQAFNSQDAALVRYEVNEFPGIFNEDLTFNASVIKYSDVPKITPILGESEFYNSEFLTDEVEIIDNPDNEKITRILKLHKSTGLSVGDTVSGLSSKSKGTISDISDFPALFTIDSSVPETIGWKDFRGNLSSILQKLPDNDYYQKFSYSLKSKIPYTDWNSIVSDISHVTGYKKFADLSIESNQIVGIGSTNNDLKVKSDFSSSINVVLTSYSQVNTVSNFDLVIEEDIDESEGAYSEFIKFRTRKLSDYILSTQNRVLSIDDISTLFDTDNAPFVEVLVDEIDTTENIVLKYFFFVGTTASFFGEFVKPQVLDLFVTRNNSTINLSSYAYYYDFFTSSGSAALPLGDIQGALSPTNGDEITINFIPRNIFNSYAIRAVKEFANVAVGVATTSFGYIRNVESTGIYTSTPSPSTSVFYSIPLSDCVAGSVFLGISSAPKRVENAFEISFVKNQNNIIDYNIFAEQKYRELGVFGITTSAGNVQFTFTPPTGIGVTLFTNFNFITNTYDVPNEVIKELSRVRSNQVIYTGSSAVSISTVSSAYAATKYIIEATKTVGLSTQKSLIQINSLHFQSYINNTVYGIIGDFPQDELDFETILNPSTSEYVLTFNPTVSATYRFRYLEKSVLNPNT